MRVDRYPGNAPFEFSRQNLGEIARCLFDLRSSDFPNAGLELVRDPKSFQQNRFDDIYDFSLARQLPELFRFNPDTILFTAKSAIPLADTIRGAYDSAQASHPNLAIINTENGEAVTTDYERRQLEPVVAEQRVAVVDQFAATGRTILSCLEFCSDLKSTDSIAIAGRWYDEVVDASMIDYSEVSSTLAPEMKSLGRQCLFVEGMPPLAA